MANNTDSNNSTNRNNKTQLRADDDNLTARDSRPSAVVKIGGVGVSNPRHLDTVAAALRAEAGGLLVVSAAAGVTDKLVHLVDAIVGRDAASAVVLHSEIEDVHRRLRTELIHDAALRASVENAHRDLLCGLKADAMAADARVPSWRRAAFLSIGERLAAPLVAAALQTRGLDAIGLAADAVGLSAAGPYTNAVPLIGRSRGRLAAALGPLLAARRTPVVTGYIARGTCGRVVTLGRGGSDSSAVAIASALGAQRVDVWKDADGFMTSDPKVVEHARRIEDLDYESAIRLSEAGAGVLQARALRLASQSSVPIRVLNLNRPQSPGTLISRQGRMAGGVVVDARRYAVVATSPDPALAATARRWRPADRHTTLARVSVLTADPTVEAIVSEVSAVIDAVSPGLRFLRRPSARTLECYVEYSQGPRLASRLHRLLYHDDERARPLLGPAIPGAD